MDLLKHNAWWCSLLLHALAVGAIWGSVFLVTETDDSSFRGTRQEALVEAQPDLFFVPPYVGPSGWVGVNLDGKVDWTMVAALLEDGYRSVAPKRAIERLDR